MRAQAAQRRERGVLLAEASMAGQYQTVLNVESESALFDAIQDCWSSVGGDRARAGACKQGTCAVAEGAGWLVRLWLAGLSAPNRYPALPPATPWRQCLWGDPLGAQGPG